MRNYDSSNAPNRYNFREEDKKKKKAHNLLWLLLLLSFLLVAIVTVIIIGVTNSWFAFTQKMEGDIAFANGIVMSYEDIDVQEGSVFHLLKQDGNGFSSLNETEVRFDDEFIIINPKLSAAEGSADFLLRAKLDYTFIKDGSELTLTGLANALNAERSTTYYNANNVLSAVFDNTINFSSDWLAGNDGWFYYAGGISQWSDITGSPNYYDMTNAAVTTSTEPIKVFDESNGEPTMRVISGEGNNMETFLISSCKISLTINACEVDYNAFSSWLVLG